MFSKNLVCFLFVWQTAFKVTNLHYMASTILHDSQGFNITVCIKRANITGSSLSLILPVFQSGINSHENETNCDAAILVPVMKLCYLKHSWAALDNEPPSAEYIYHYM